MEQAPRRPILTSLPNILTYGRIAAVPVLVAMLFFSDKASARWMAFAVFVVASLTDWLDGYLARIWEQQSALGRMLDPIADKLLVGATLLMLVYDGPSPASRSWPRSSSCRAKFWSPACANSSPSSTSRSL